jgi:hypothetical protein
MNGKQPYSPDMILQRGIRPAAVAAGITKHWLAHLPAYLFDAAQRCRYQGDAGAAAPCQQPHHPRHLSAGNEF